MSAYLPLGAASDSRAPYNETESKECPECGQDMISQTYKGVTFYECPFCGHLEDDEHEY